MLRDIQQHSLFEQECPGGPMFYFSLFIISLQVFSSFSLAMRPNSEDTSIYNECLWNKELLDIEVDCNDLFHHYQPQSHSPQSDSELRLGSFNIFRISDQRTYKRIDLNAQMINSEWDVVSLQELQPNRALDMSFNVNARMAFSENKIDQDQLNKAYTLPPYVELLLELQKSDPSWGLLISPYSQGTDTELFGFIYRGSRVQPVESEYCSQQLDLNSQQSSFIFRELDAVAYGTNGLSYKKDGRPVNLRSYVSPKKALACHLALTGETQEQFSKIPFTARFQANDFDFNYVTLHSRFRALDESLSDCVEACQNTAQKMLELIFNRSPGVEINQKISEQLLKDNKISKGEAREINRYFEAFVTVEETLEIKKIEKDSDVMIAGDFNLEYMDSQHWRSLIWQKIKNLEEGLLVLITDKTSLSDQKGYGSNYDHFIFNTTAGQTANCSVESAQVVDFVNSELTLSNGFELGLELAKFKDPKRYDEVTRYYKERHQGKAWVTDSAEYFLFSDVSEISIDKLPADLIRSTRVCDGSDTRFDTQELKLTDSLIADLECNLLYASQPYRHLSFAMSDHLPISLTCSLN